ncbi:M42 family metallopeptidase [Halonatronum saccharophilum]|uniref:M42 family metallopeptidase n=1 Tax=Halonatronum saccharophilum TaxID=150060 RepID=UPI000480227A|nr:M42 family metallopeptidase [Halonatronum saccharophilum]
MEDKMFLKKLSEELGVSGYEEDIAKTISSSFETYVDDIRYDTMGNLIAYKKGQGENRPKIMLAAHMDEIGLMVTKIEEGGFLRFTTVGGVDQRTLVGQEIVIYGKESLIGIIGAKPPHIQSKEEQKKAFKVKDMYIDLGLSEEEVKSLVQIGDTITVKREFSSLRNDRVTGKALDDRAGVLMILEIIKLLSKLKHRADIYAVATVQEEVGVRGAITSTYGIVPDVGIAIDVCHATMPGVSKEDASELGEGPAIGFGPHVHPQIFNRFKDLADKLDIPYQVEPSTRPGGTDAYSIQVSRCGVATGLISIPLRYMHTSVETVSMEDIRRGARLLTHFIGDLNGEFVEGLRCF